MAATQYQVFCRYLNENVNKIVSNTSTAEWVSAEEWYQCKVAYNVTNASQTNAMLITQDSINTNVKKESTYKALYDALVSTMNTVRANGSRLRYTEFSAEEKRVYDICHRYAPMPAWSMGAKGPSSSISPSTAILVFAFPVARISTAARMDWGLAL